MNNLILIGGGGHCKSCIEVIEKTNEYKICGIIEKEEFQLRSLMDYPIIGNDNDLADLREKFEYAFITIGQIYSSQIRKNIYKILINLNYEIPTIVSPISNVSKYSKIGNGVIVMHSAVIYPGAIIGNNSIINSKALIEHDVIIEENCHISTGAIVNGGAHISQGSFIGSGAIVSNNIKIGANSFVGLGMKITHNLEKNSKVK